MIELSMHNIVISQPFKYQVSYILSMVYSSTLIIELLRAYDLLGKKYKEEELEFNFELKLMHRDWTKDLKKSEKDKGNTFMIRDRVRWTLFQIVIAGV